MTTQTPLFSGSIVALVTPMDNHGNIDFETLEKLIEFHINAGTDSKAPLTNFTFDDVEPSIVGERG